MLMSSILSRLEPIVDDAPPPHVCQPENADRNLTGTVQSACSVTTRDPSQKMSQDDNAHGNLVDSVAITECDAGSSVNVDVCHNSIPIECSFPSQEIEIEFGLPLPRDQSKDEIAEMQGKDFAIDEDEEEAFGESVDVDNIVVPHSVAAPYMIKSIGNPLACQIMQPFQEESARITADLVENPESVLGQQAGQLKKRSITHNAGVYAILDQDDKVVKIGYTKDFLNRRDVYHAKDGIHKDRFVIMFDLDSIDKNMNQQLCDLYGRAKQALLSSTELPAAMMNFYRQMFEQGGERMGGRSTFVLQTVESGQQGVYGLQDNPESAQEYLAGCPEVENRWYQDSAWYARALFDAFPEPLRRAAKEGFG